MKGYGTAFTILIMMVLATGHLNSACADLKQDLGYTLLSDELGAALPTGIDVTVTQVEADPDGNFTVLTYTPDDSNTQFDGKTITDKSESSMGASSHATVVGQYYYGNTNSLAPGVSDIHSYVFSASAGLTWLVHGYLLTSSTYQPMYYFNPLLYTLSSPGRVVNHSWVGSVPGYNAEVLRRSDFVVETDEFVHVAAVNNGSTQNILMSGLYNGITVGRTDGYHPSSTIAADTAYTAGRTCPLIVVPLARTSYTAPVVASAAALLIQTGRETDMAIDPEQTATTDRSNRFIVNAERSETIKAALLAGARRMTYNGSTTAQIFDYRAQDGNCTDNGLDTRYGAGQLDIYNSYHIIAAGEQNSAQDDGSGNGDIESMGFDVDPYFGGLAGSNTTGSYRFMAGSTDRRLYASLVWHIDIDGGTWNSFDGSTVLYDLDLTVYDTTADSAGRVVCASAGHIENTENLWCAIVPGRSYRIEVTRAETQSGFVWDYALAWRMTAPDDSDGDGMDDEWEVEHGLDYTDAGDVTVDADHDGLGALEEYQYGTTPEQSDTDGDGTLDGAEVATGTDPLDPAEYPKEVSAASPGGIALVTLLIIMVIIVGRGVPCGRKARR